MKTVLRSMLLVVLALLLFVPACTSTPPVSSSPTRRSKGYEIYAWPKGPTWCFSLLPGTNDIKTHGEVTADRTRLVGYDRLKKQLAELEPGERVTWMDSCLGEGNEIHYLPPPPGHVVDEIRTHCVELRLETGF